MKLNAKTTSILSNFSIINPSILIREGDTVMCVSPSKTIMGRAVVPNQFPKRFAIYSLPQFLSTVSLFENAELNFNDEYIEISAGDGERVVHYNYTAENLVTPPPESGLNMPSLDVEVKLTGKALSSTIKAAGVLQLPYIAFVGDGTNVYLQALQSEKDIGNTYKVKLGTTDKKFKSIYKVENLLKIMNGDYDIQISKKGISHLKNDSVEYWILVEAISSYEF